MSAVRPNTQIDLSRNRLHRLGQRNRDSLLSSRCRERCGIARVAEVSRLENHRGNRAAVEGPEVGSFVKAVAPDVIRGGESVRYEPVPHASSELG